MFGLSIEDSVAWANTVIFWALLAVALAGGLVAFATFFAFRWQGELDKLRAEAFAKYQVSAGVAIANANASAASANQKAEEERLARVKLEAKIAPRSLTQLQQNDLTSLLAGLPKQTGTIIASPSTPESEWFSRVLTAPLKMAGWEITILPGSATATLLQPTGVVIQYSADFNIPVQDQPERSKAAVALADALKSLGIDATAIPGIMQAPMTMQITITPK